MEVAPVYLQKKQASSEGGARFSTEVLTSNNIKLTSFVATHAAAVEMKIDNYDEKELPLSDKKGGPIIIEYTVRANVRSTEMTKLLQLLDRIEKSKEARGHQARDRTRYSQQAGGGAHRFRDRHFYLQKEAEK